MCPNPTNGQPYQWEKDLPAIDDEEKIARIEEQATAEIERAIEEAIEKKKLKNVAAMQLRLNEDKALKTALANQRVKLAALQSSSQQTKKDPPQPILEVPKEPPKVPPSSQEGMLNVGRKAPKQVQPKIVSPKETAKQQAEKAKEEKRKQNLTEFNKIKQEAKERASKANDKELAELEKNVAAELKEVEAEIRALEGKILFEGGPPLGRLVRDSEPKEDGSPNDYDPIQGIIKEVNEKNGEVHRMQSALEAVQKSSRLAKMGDIVEHYQDALNAAKRELDGVEKGKEAKIALIKKEIAEYKQKIEVLDKKKEQKKAVIAAIADVKREKPEKVVSSKDPHAMVNHAAKKMASEIAKVDNFSFEEQIILRNFFYGISPNLETDNPLRWNNQRFETELKNALFFGRLLPYTNPSDPRKPGLKELIGRSVFEDENNPVRVKKMGEVPIGKISPDLAAAIGANRQTGSQEPSSPSVGIGGPSGTEDSTMPKYQPPTGPQRDLSGEDTALKILKNVINNIVIKDRYDRAGEKKSFVSLYLKKQNKDRPEQIQYLQNAVHNAANNIALLRGELTYLDDGHRKVRLEEIFNEVIAALDKVEKDMAAQGHKQKGTSRMENVISHLRNEISTMKIAVGLEASKPSTPKKSSPS